MFHRHANLISISAGFPAHVGRAVAMVDGREA
jgi:hypothetical protein